MYWFQNDYSTGCHPKVLEAIAESNGLYFPGYGKDGCCARCAALIRDLCGAPQAGVEFLAGGTQTNAVTIGAFLRPWESVICPVSGHINGHEAGAVEGLGHKLLPVPVSRDGKLAPAQILPLVEAGQNEHVTLPRLVYLSDATENGAVYTRAELAALSRCCRENGLLLFLDGARLGCAFAAQENDLTLPDLARLTDAFTIGGTKNGALMGEALVLVRPDLQSQFFRMKKRAGAVLAKGWLLGLQFQALLNDGLYWELARHAVDAAQKLQSGLKQLGVPLLLDSPTNQIFPVFSNALLPALHELCTCEIWERVDENHTVIRLVTSYATKQEEVTGFLAEIGPLLRSGENFAKAGSEQA